MVHALINKKDGNLLLKQTKHLLFRLLLFEIALFERISNMSHFYKSNGNLYLSVFHL